MITVSEFDRVQELLGQEGKPRPHYKRFAYTGLVRCGECGSMVTAEDKKKPAKNGGFFKYIYYHCTKRKPHIKCNQSCIREEELEEQIKDLLSTIHISEKKTQVILRALKIMHKEESATQNARLDSIQKSYKNAQNRLNNLLSIRLEGLINDEEYKIKKNQLIIEKAQLEEKLQDNNGRVGDWLDVAEKTFNFASRASYWFEHGTIEDKKAIIQCFGSNFILKDKNLHAEIRQPFVVIKDCLTGLEKESNRLELLQTTTQSRGDTPILSQNSSWWSLLDHIRTFFESFQEEFFIPTL